MSLFRKKNPIDRVNLLILYFIRINFIIAIASAAFQQDWSIMFVSLAGLLTTFVITFFEKRYKIDIPTELEFVLLIFVYASIFLGELRGYYTRFWWWDIVLHTGSGLALGLVGFIIMYTLDQGGRIKASPFLIAFFSFCFALALGALWEIFEFGIDQTLGTNMQKSGLMDTMLDLIVDSIGALITATLGYFYVRGVKGRFFGKIVERFVRENPQLFTRL